MMKALRISLIASSVVLATGTPCFAADSAATIAPKDQVKVDVKPAADVSATDKGTYPFGQPAIKEDAAKSIWTANLPGRGITIKSQWTNEPTFTVEPNGDGKFEGIVSLKSVNKPAPGSLTTPLISALIYVYEPSALNLDTTNPAAVIKTLIDDIATQARQFGLTVNVDKINGKSEKVAGVLEDARRKSTFLQKIETPKKGEEVDSDDDKSTEMETTEQVVQTQYSRLLIGKDFVILGLVVGDADLSEKDAQAFLDNISIQQTAQPVQPPKPASKY